MNWLERVPIPLSIKQWENKRLSFYWTSLTKLRQAKRLINPYANKNILSFSKQNLRILTGLPTGHCTLRYHMGKLGLSDQSICRLCLEEEESSEQVMCNCEAVAILRGVESLAGPRETNGIKILPRV
jgi:hypothetical protein